MSDSTDKDSPWQYGLPIHVEMFMDRCKGELCPCDYVAMTQTCSVMRTAFKGKIPPCAIKQVVGEAKKRQSITRLEIPDNLEQVLHTAFYGNDGDTELLAFHQWNTVLFCAAFGGHKDICELAIERGEACNGHMTANDWNGMLANAARGGHKDLCELAKARGANDCDCMLRNAAEGGHRDICLLAKAHGANNLDWMLVSAAYGGHLDICKLAIEWGANNWDWMLANAAEGGHRDICELAKARGANDWNWMLRCAYYEGQKEICELAVEWGATNNSHYDF